MTIIDCHTHLGRNNHICANVSELIKSMDEAGIDKSFVFAGELTDYPTYEMLKEIEQYKDRLYGVASWDFDPLKINPMIYGMWAIGMSQEKVLAELYRQQKIVAVKFYTGYYHHMPDGAIIRGALKELSKVGCPVIFHCGDCLNSVKCAKLKYAHPLNIDEVAVDFPEINFIIAHMGYPWHRDAAQVCFKNKNVYADMSGFVYGAFKDNDQINFEKVLNEFCEVAGGSDKLLFGTDWPISNQSSYVKTVKLLGWHPDLMLKNILKAFKLES